MCQVRFHLRASVLVFRLVPASGSVLDVHARPKPFSSTSFEALRSVTFMEPEGNVREDGVSRAARTAGEVIAVELTRHLRDPGLSPRRRRLGVILRDFLRGFDEELHLVARAD